MRRKHRGILAVFVVAVLAIAGSLTAWRLWAGYLPDPRRAVTQGLMRWLVLVELADEPRDRQILLVDRFESVLRAQSELGGDAAALSEPYRERLQRNTALLKRVWFESRVERYTALPDAERFDYLSAQIQTVMVWSQLDIPSDQAVRPVGSLDGSHAATMRFFSDMERWIAEADQEAAARMQQAVRDGLTCWLATSSLADQPMATRREIAGRIEAELDSGLRLDQVAGSLTHQQEQTLRSNGLLLLEAWLHNSAERYAALPTDQRTAFVDAQLDRIQQWQLIDFLESPSEGDSAADSPAGAVALLATVDRWVERADADLRPPLSALVRHVQQRLLWRSFRGLWE